MRYRRVKLTGASYFFTVVTRNRLPIFSQPGAVNLLRKAFRKVKQERPFAIDAMVVLPDHLHCIWTLPDGDDDYSTRWRLIKTWFTKNWLCAEQRCWQGRFWEHLIRDAEDWRRHMDYIHYNPVKHGLVQRVVDWPYSSFMYCVERGWYDASWGERVNEVVLAMDVE